MSRDKTETRDDLLRESHKRGEFIDQFTTVIQEPWQITLARVPKCCQKRRKEVMQAKQEIENDERS